MSAVPNGSPREKENPALPVKQGGAIAFKTASVTGSTQSAARPWSVKERQAIAESIVGPVTWQGEEGFCCCPGEGRHTTRTTPTDCKVVCEPVEKGDGILKPGVYCFHGSCASECEAGSHQLRSALGRRSPSTTNWRTSRHPVILKPKPEFNPAKLAKLAAALSGIDAAWLAERSPIRPDTRTPVSFLHPLYEPDEKVVVFDVFESQGQAVWTCKNPPFDARELDSFRRGKPHGVWFLTNPVSGDFVETDRIGRDGKKTKSRRSWRSVTSWRYLVIESDKAHPGHWLAALVQMPLRVAAIYTSGGKSIHALVRLNAASKSHWDALCDAMKPALVTLGADQKALSAVRLSRLAGCERVEKAAMQTLLYLNPKPKCRPIVEMPIIASGWSECKTADQNGEESLQ